MANNKLNTLKEIHKQEETLYVERNEKYGDSFSKTFQEYGPTVALIRLEDKLNRAKSLISNGLDGSDGESIIDTLKDNGSIVADRIDKGNRSIPVYRLKDA